MKTILASLVISLALGLAAAPANAACYADYKARKSAPFQLHYGVIELPDNICNQPRKISRNIQKRISVGGWRLLNVMSVFGPEGLQQRRASAGRFFLKY